MRIPVSRHPRYRLPEFRSRPSSADSVKIPYPIFSDGLTMQKPTLVWFRRNLRLTDNAALAAAVRRGLPVAGVFAADAANPRQAAFLRASAAELHRALAERGIPLFVAQEAETDIPRLAAELDAAAVVADEGCMADETARDNRIWRVLDAQGRAFERVNDGAVFARAEIMDEHGRPYFEFAPYRQAWLRAFAQRFADRRPSESLPVGFQTAFGILPPFPALPETAPQERQQQGGEAAGRRQWARFAADIGNYPLMSGFPAKKGTGRVGAYLAAGCLSPRELAQAAVKRGAAQWLDNLVRRDFFRQVMFHRPEAAAEALRPEYRGIKWPGGQDVLVRWQQGQTGFPLIDAAMRSLNATGWLHPALRAAAAVFLCRILLADWRHGAAWFARCLTDYDPASNTGNWQEAAGVAGLFSGAAANPVLQAQQLDPDGTFIRRYVPELAHLPKDVIHAPWLARASVDTHGYPPPMADCARQGRAYAALFR